MVLGLGRVTGKGSLGLERGKGEGNISYPSEHDRRIKVMKEKT